MKTGRKIVIGLIVLWVVVRVAIINAPMFGRPVRYEVLLPMMLVFVIPIRSVRKTGTRLYSALLYRVVSRPGEHGKRVRTVQWWPKNAQPLDEDEK